MNTLQETINENNLKDKRFFELAFKGYTVPDNIKRLSTRLCRSYGINGICDPMYIANVIAYELGMGDGSGNFKN